MDEFPDSVDSFDMNSYLFGGEPIGGHLLEDISTKNLIELEQHDRDLSVNNASDVLMHIEESDLLELHDDLDLSGQIMYETYCSGGSTSEESENNFENIVLHNDVSLPELSCIISFLNGPLVKWKDIEPKSKLVLAPKNDNCPVSSRPRFQVRVLRNSLRSRKTKGLSVTNSIKPGACPVGGFVSTDKKPASRRKKNSSSNDQNSSVGSKPVSRKKKNAEVTSSNMGAKLACPNKKNAVDPNSNMGGKPACQRNKNTKDTNFNMGAKPVCPK